MTASQSGAETMDTTEQARMELDASYQPTEEAMSKAMIQAARHIRSLEKKIKKLQDFRLKVAEVNPQLDPRPTLTILYDLIHEAKDLKPQKTGARTSAITARKAGG